MKVYYELSAEENELIAGYEAINAEFGGMAKGYVTMTKEKQKYQIMWELRSIEDKINEEGGCIIITSTGQLMNKDFTPETSAQIKELLKLALDK